MHQCDSASPPAHTPGAAALSHCAHAGDDRLTVGNGMPRLVTACRSRDARIVSKGAAKRALVKAGEQLGFLDPRVARIEPLERGPFYEAWLADGRAGDMKFLEHHKKARLDPRTRYRWARTVLSAFFPYDAPPPAPLSWREELRGRVAAYALGPDYHDVMGARLGRWADAVRSALPGTEVKPFVDTGAVFEHEWAARAGVGWTGKHTLTLSERRGSYAFLGELLLEAELEPDPPVADRCGTCSRCIDVCPTAAIEDGYRLDPRRCISYLTIEHRGVIDRDLRPLIGEWLFGCDLCQIVCPWNDGAHSAARDELAPRLTEILRLDENGFEARYGASSLRRTGRVGLARNAAVVLGNTANPDAVRPLAWALREHESALVREHAAGALTRLVDVTADARKALESACDDPSERVRAEVALGLADPSG